MAAYSAPRKNSSSAMPLTTVITSSNGHRALVGVVEDVLDLVVERRDLADHQPADDEDPGQDRPEGKRPQQGRPPGWSSPRRVRPRWRGPDANAPTAQIAARPMVAK